MASVFFPVIAPSDGSGERNARGLHCQKLNYNSLKKRPQKTQLYFPRYISLGPTQGNVQWALRVKKHAVCIIKALLSLWVVISKHVDFSCNFTISLELVMSICNLVLKCQQRNVQCPFELVLSIHLSGAWVWRVYWELVRPCCTRQGLPTDWGYSFPRLQCIWQLVDNILCLLKAGLSCGANACNSTHAHSSTVLCTGLVRRTKAGLMVFVYKSCGELSESSWVSHIDVLHQVSHE